MLVLNLGGSPAEKIGCQGGGARKGHYARRSKRSVPKGGGVKPGKVPLGNKIKALAVKHAEGNKKKLCAARGSRKKGGCSVAEGAGKSGETRRRTGGKRGCKPMGKGGGGRKALCATGTREQGWNLPLRGRSWWR